MKSLIMCPYGLRHLLECISRVALLSQSAEITEIIKQYWLELLSFAKSFPETNPENFLFHFQRATSKAFLNF